MTERTCPVCGEAVEGHARKRYCSRKCQAHGVHVANYGDRKCGHDECQSKHFAKGACRRHYYQARWAAGADGAATTGLLLYAVARLHGTGEPKVKRVRCTLTVGLMVACPRCGQQMTASSPSDRACPSCKTTVELNPEEVSWVIYETHSTARPRETAS